MHWTTLLATPSFSYYYEFNHLYNKLHLMSIISVLVGPHLILIVSQIAFIFLGFVPMYFDIFTYHKKKEKKRKKKKRSQLIFLDHHISMLVPTLKFKKNLKNKKHANLVEIHFPDGGGTEFRFSLDAYCIFKNLPILVYLSVCKNFSWLEHLQFFTNCFIKFKFNE